MAIQATAKHHNHSWFSCPIFTVWQNITHPELDSSCNYIEHNCEHLESTICYSCRQNADEHICRFSWIICEWFSLLLDWSGTLYGHCKL